MFDIKQNFPSTITINEHRAPSEDSIRLADEMRAKVEQDFIRQCLYEIGDNRISGLVFEKECTGLDSKIHVGFNLNGNPMHFLLPVTMHLTKTQILEKFVQILSEQIALAIMQDVSHKVSWTV